MQFYTHQHKHYCGIDLHASSMYLCILDSEGNVLLHKKVNTTPEAFLHAIAPYRDDLVVGVECVFMWYWISDLCVENDIAFVLGHALYMKAISGGKAKNDRIDSKKLAAMLRGGMFPLAYTYPRDMRSTRDLLRRRNYFMRHRAELLGHIQNTNTQYNQTPILKKVAYKANRPGVAEKFSNPSVRKSIEADLLMTDHYDALITDLELYITNNAKIHDAQAFHLLRSVPGIGKILALVILYEVHDINRFDRVQEFASYARLVKCQHSSAGKIHGSGGRKIGNAHLKWAFSEAAVLFLRRNPKAQKYKAQLEKKHGKGKALSIIAHRLGRCVYFILKRRKPFQMAKFFNN